MNNCLAWSRQLNLLLENNFKVVQFYRKIVNQTDEKYLINLFERQISKRAHFAAELRSEIKFLGYSPLFYAFRKRSKYFLKEDREILLNRCIYMERTSLMDYKKTLSEINNGHSREILIRHKSKVENTIQELANLKLKLILMGRKKEELRKIN